MVFAERLRLLRQIWYITQALLSRLVGVQLVGGGAGIRDVLYIGQDAVIRLGLRLDDAEITDGEAVVEVGQGPTENEPSTGIVT